MPAENMPSDFFLNTQFNFVSNQVFVGQLQFLLLHARGYWALSMLPYIRLAIYDFTVLCTICKMALDRQQQIMVAGIWNRNFYFAL